MENQAKKYYDELHKLSYQTQLLSGVSGLIARDQETYMPEGAAAIRAEQLEALSGIIHEAKTSKKFSSALSKLIDIPTGKILVKGLTDPQIAAVRAWARDYTKEVVLPQAFVEEFTKLTSEALVAWSHAKKENTFQTFAPYLDRIVAMNRQKAGC